MGRPFLTQIKPIQSIYAIIVEILCSRWNSYRAVRQENATFVSKILQKVEIYMLGSRLLVQISRKIILPRQHGWNALSSFDVFLFGDRCGGIFEQAGELATFMIKFWPVTEQMLGIIGMDHVQFAFRVTVVPTNFVTTIRRIGRMFGVLKTLYEFLISSRQQA